MSELRGLLGDEGVDPSLRHRDRLIEHLHALQDTYGYLTMPRLRALATFMNICPWPPFMRRPLSMPILMSFTANKRHRPR